MDVDTSLLILNICLAAFGFALSLYKTTKRIRARCCGNSIDIKTAADSSSTSSSPDQSPPSMV